MKKKVQKAKFYEDGIQFECQGSGNCCVSRGEFGYVYVSLQDRKLLAKTLKLSLEKFTDLYCYQVEGAWALKEEPKSLDCVFLKDRKCTVYEGRPIQCRTWPFWPEVMSAKRWKKDVAQFCPGVGKGRTYSKREIEKLMNDEAKNVSAVINEARALLIQASQGS